MRPDPVGQARSVLFVPGDRPDRFAKAEVSGADLVVLDLEDAVRPDRKDAARAEVVTWLSGPGTGCVRINPAASQWYGADVAAIAATPGLVGLMLPTAEDRHDVATLTSAVPEGVRIVLLVETALGLSRVAELAAAAGTARLAFGSLDFALDIGAAHVREALLLARSTLVYAARVAGLAPPLDGVTTDLADDDALRADAEHARDLGFTGKLCIHPRQVPAVNTTFTASPDEVAWAHRVIAATDGADGAIALDGQMVDRPVVERARRILAVAQQQ